MCTSIACYVNPIALGVRSFYANVQQPIDNEI